MIPFAGLVGIRLGTVAAGMVVKLMLGAGIFLYIINTIQAKAVLEREVELSQKVNQQVIKDFEAKEKRRNAQDKRERFEMDRLKLAKDKSEKNKQAIIDSLRAAAEKEDQSNIELCPSNCILP